MTYRAVLFDACGVLLRKTHRYDPDAWGRQIGFNNGDLTETIWNAIGDCSASVPTRQHVRRQLVRLLGIPEERADALLRDFNRDWQPDQQLTAFVRALRRDYRTGMITNGQAGVRFCRMEQFAGYGVDSLFDVLVVSGEEGLAKPAPAVYRLAADRLALRVGECLFVDDKPENVQGALEVGMGAIQHADTAQTIGLLTDALL